MSGKCDPVMARWLLPQICSTLDDVISPKLPGIGSVIGMWPNSSQWAMKELFLRKIYFFLNCKPVARWDSIFPTEPEQGSVSFHSCQILPGHQEGTQLEKKVDIHREKTCILDHWATGSTRAGSGLPLGFPECTIEKFLSQWGFWFGK